MTLALGLGWLSVGLGRRVIPPLLPSIIEDLAITPSRAGFALTVLLVFFAALQYPGGRLSDQLSRETVLVTGVGVLTVGAGLVAVATGYPGLLLGLAAFGTGAGLFSIPARGLLSDLFVARRGTAFGLFQSAGRVGNMLAAGLAVAALAVATWQAAFLPLVGAFVLTGVAVHVFRTEPYVVRRPHLEFRDTVGRLLATKEVPWVLVTYMCFTLSWNGTLGFLPTFLQAEKGLAPTPASAVFAAVFVVGTLVTPLAGDLSDRTDRLPVVVAALALGLVGLATLVAAPGLVGVVAGVVVFATGLSSFPAVMQAYLMDLFDDESMAGDFGALKTIYSGVGSLGPTFVGTVAERASYGVALTGLAGTLVVGILLVLWLRLRVTA